MWTGDTVATESFWPTQMCPSPSTGKCSHLSRSGPLEAKLVHEGLAAVLCPHRKWSSGMAGWLSPKPCTLAHTWSTGRLEFRRALYLDQRVKLVDLQPCILLVVVSDPDLALWFGCSDVRAQGDGYGLTEAVVGKWLSHYLRDTVQTPQNKHGNISAKNRHKLPLACIVPESST